MKPPAETVAPGAKTNLRGELGSSLRLKSARLTELVAGLNSSSQSEVEPSALVSEWLLARNSLRTTGTPTLEVMMLVVYWIALRNMPKTLSELPVAFWCSSTAMTLSPETRLLVVKARRKSGRAEVSGW